MVLLAHITDFSGTSPIDYIRSSALPEIEQCFEIKSWDSVGAESLPFSTITVLNKSFDIIAQRSRLRYSIGPQIRFVSIFMAYLGGSAFSA